MTKNTLNPFKPIFGKTPPILIGREPMIDEYISSLDSYLYDDRITTLFVGQRGMGKTVVLNEVSKRAVAKGWVSVDVSMSENLLANAYDRLRIEAGVHLSAQKSKLTGVTLNIMGFGAGVSTDTHQEDFSTMTKIGLIVEELSKKGVGVLFTIDEARSKSEALREFASNYQLLLRKDLKVGCAIAGLPFEISGLINDEVLTFLRRANRVVLSQVDIDDVAIAYIKVFNENGESLPFDVARVAAEKTQGYPYLIQLLGSVLWDTSGNGRITEQEVVFAAEAARRKMYQNVVEPMAADLTRKETEFVTAMAELDQPSAVSDIADAMGLKQTDVAQYRKQLIDKYFVYSPARGRLDFVLPYSKEYLLEKP
ncbi:MAG: ATP-binding protein [Clostridiales Family XIII bacterium]|jgi:hypothetical protein|nr:ATP-binding protein [Clostridiales Family XIII bacterium]